ncbi:SET domain-containing protein [Mollisia scopiformis]|uniref:SET domain-containing protein n=1 Tax=Mollisia scopiformis TaxID=149040 RepID=A0A194X6A9_MOLSC|nr:SET domain-containing protein [Mollisia scopiformis]KUJ15347.1 SET domain-containing protein [Mollisia scopiformis]
MASVGELLRWGQQHDTTLDERVEVYQDSITGLSFRALEEIPHEIKIATSSHTTTLSYLNAVQSLGYSRYNSPEFPPQFLAELEDEFPHIIGHFFLMQQYLMEKESFWWQYISLLPQPDEPERMPTPMWWSAEDIYFLAGTNSAPAIEKKIALWKSDYEKGLAKLTSNAEHYTWDLYKWAATIFGTRSFRPSLTTSWATKGMDVLDTSSFNNTKALTHVLNDHFSILFPIVDIGNHNGENTVRWSAEPNNSFSVITTSQTTKGSQIYNFYGIKSNSELLVGYGFTLDKGALDVVNLKIQPPSSSTLSAKSDFDAHSLRRSQKCHIDINYNRQPEEEWMYNILSQPPLPDRLLSFQLLSHGLIETLSCLVANERERRFLSASPEYCLEKGSKTFSGTMSRNIIAVYHLLYDKLLHDVEKLRTTSKDLGPPRNSNQVLALDYRKKQSSVLEHAMFPFTTIVQTILRHNDFCEQSQHLHSQALKNFRSPPFTGGNDILSLECAYDWLGRTYPEVYGPLASFVSTLEDEPVPPRWEILANDFGNVYWTVWIFVVYVLQDHGIKNGDSGLPYSQLCQWLSRMHS